MFSRIGTLKIKKNTNYDFINISDLVVYYKNQYLIRKINKYSWNPKTSAFMYFAVCILYLEYRQCGCVHIRGLP